MGQKVTLSFRFMFSSPVFISQSDIAAVSAAQLFICPPKLLEAVTASGFLVAESCCSLCISPAFLEELPATGELSTGKQQAFAGAPVFLNQPYL